MIVNLKLLSSDRVYRKNSMFFFIYICCFLLKGDTMIVDTPGIGGSEEATQKLMEYLPNALSFVFVINVASAGGMQKDRVFT